MCTRILSRISGINRPVFALLLITLAVFATGCNEEGTLMGPPQASPTVQRDDTTPPAAPEDVTGTYFPQMNLARLNWAPNTTDPDLAGFILYRENGDDVEALLDAPTMVVTYQDFDVPHGENRYCLRAVDTSGNQSAICTTIVWADDTEDGVNFAED